MLTTLALTWPCPRRFCPILGQNESQGPKNETFQKINITPPSIYRDYKCAKFQQYLISFRFPSLPQRFCPIFRQNGSQRPKNENIQKIGKKTPRYLPKLQVCQISTRSDLFLVLQPGSKILAHFGAKRVPGAQN